MLEAVEGRLCSLEVLEGMRCMLLHMLDAVESGLSFGVAKFHCGSFSSLLSSGKAWVRRLC